MATPGTAIASALSSLDTGSTATALSVRLLWLGLAATASPSRDARDVTFPAINSSRNVCYQTFLSEMLKVVWHFSGNVKQRLAGTVSALTVQARCKHATVSVERCDISCNGQNLLQSLTPAPTLSVWTAFAAKALAMTAVATVKYPLQQGAAAAAVARTTAAADAAATATRITTAACSKRPA